MPRKHDATRNIRADMRVKRGLGALGIRDACCSDTEIVKVALDKIDEIEVAVAADCRKTTSRSRRSRADRDMDFSVMQQFEAA